MDQRDDAVVEISRDACPWFARRRFYQCFCNGATTAKQRQCEASILGLTPSPSAYSGSSYTVRHSHSASLAMTSPTNSSTADQTSAETKLAIWNGQ